MHTRECLRLPLAYPPWTICVFNDKGSIERELAIVTHMELARGLFWHATHLFPKARILLRQRAHVLGDSERLDGFPIPKVFRAPP
jgi:hypothetical protein